MECAVAVVGAVAGDQVALGAQALATQAQVVPGNEVEVATGGEGAGLERRITRGADKTAQGERSLKASRTAARRMGVKGVGPGLYSFLLPAILIKGHCK